MANINFMLIIFITIDGLVPAENKIGIISSEVERKTASIVPKEMRPVLYKLDEETENPHWGINPKKAPTIGPYCFDFLT